MLQQLRNQGLPLQSLHTVFQVIVLSRLLYGLHARGPLLNMESVNRIDIKGFLGLGSAERLHVCDCVRVPT